MIAQLKAENFELKQKEREYNVIKSQIMDLEHRFRLVQEEKSRMDNDDKEREEMQYRKSEVLQDTLRKSNNALADIDAEIKDRLRKLKDHKLLIDDRNDEMVRLRKVLADSADDIERIDREKGILELELRNAHNDHRTAEERVNNIVEESQQLKMARSVEETRARELEEEANQLRRRLRDIQTIIDATEKD